MKSKAQIATQFHWIFIAVAGAIILIFFISIVVKQKDVAEQRIAATVLSDFEQILTGAGMREATLNKIEIPKTELEFRCTDSYSEYSIKRTGLHRETPTDIIFAPDTVKGPHLYLWTLSFEAPFKVTNFLMVTSSKIRYYIVYNENDEASKNLAAQTFDELPEQITKEKIQKTAMLNPNFKDKKDYKVRFVFVATSIVSEVPQSLAYLKEDISAVSIYPDFVQFYSNKNNKFVTNYPEDKIPLLQFQEPEPMLYAAVFAENSEAYKCALKKAFKRLYLISEINKERAKKFTDTQNCYYSAAENKFKELSNEALACAENINNNCIASLKNAAESLETYNTGQFGLMAYNCHLVY